jgi:hypothetical protein
MSSKRKDLPVKNSNKSLNIKSNLIEDLRQIIEKTRQSIPQRSMPVLQYYTGM